MEVDVPDGDIPPIFRSHRTLQPLSSSSSSAAASAADKRPPQPPHRELEAFEKNWLCGEVLGTNLGLNGKYRPMRKRAALMQEYGLYKRFFQRHMPIYMKQGTMNPCHRPSNIDSEDVIFVIEQVNKAKAEGKSVSKQDVYDMFREAKYLRTEDIMSDRFDFRASRAADKTLTIRSMDKCISKYRIGMPAENDKSA